MSLGRTVLGGGVLAEVHTPFTVTNTVTPTDMFQGLLTIPAGIVRPGDILQVIASGTWLNNTGSNINLGTQLNIGASAAGGTGTVAWVTGTNPYLWTLDIIIHVAATAQQYLRTNYFYSQTTNGKMGIISTGNCMTGSASITEDLSTAKTVQQVMTMGTASASAAFVCRSAALLLIRESPHQP